MKRKTIAIDGSAASGKSTLGSRLAKKLNYLYLDTGVMYRSVTWAALEAGFAMTDEPSISALAKTIDLDLRPPTIQDGRQATVLVNKRDVTWLLRSPKIDAIVAQVSSHPNVRQAIKVRQRAIAQKGPVVMVGRDIGTVVLPEADLKLFIQASLAVRAERRYQECLKRGEHVVYEDLLAAMAHRDKQDREKPISPMIPAKDAIIIKTDNLTVEEVLQRVEKLVYVEWVIA